MQPIHIRVDIPASNAAVELVRGWAKADVGPALPVGPVVSRMPPWPSVIGNLVVLVTHFRQDSVCVEELLLEALFRGFGHAAPTNPAAQWCLGFHRQSIDRHVRWGEARQYIQVAFPPAFDEP